MNGRWILGTLFTALAVQSAAGQQLTPRHRTALADSLQEFALRTERIMQQANADSIVALYGRPNEFVNIENGEAISFQRMVESIRQYTQSVSASPVRWLGRPTIMILGVNAAVLHGTHRFDGGPNLPAHTGMWSAVLERIDGQWRIVHAHGSERAQPAGSR